MVRVSVRGTQTTARASVARRPSKTNETTMSAINPNHRSERRATVTTRKSGVDE
jgi:hypothetical protein